MPFATCQLCKIPDQIVESHVLPKLVFRWKKKSSATGQMRFGKTPNKRVQDGEKRYWLCERCETRLCGWESEFASKIFEPVCSGQFCPVDYREWLLKFCVSVSWRVGKLFVEDGLIAQFGPQAQAQLADALGEWSKFILGEAKHPGVHRQHLAIFPPIGGDVPPETPPNINRYLLRAVEMQVAVRGDDVIVFAKMGPIAVVGSVGGAGSKKWGSSMVHVKKGTVLPNVGPIHGELWEFLKLRASRYGDLYSEISDTQKKKIADAMHKDLDRVSGSQTLRALELDHEIFGEDAFKDIN